MDIEKQNSCKSKSLSELAREEIMRQIPLMIYLIILCIVGIAGNILVCYIYTKKYNLSTFRIFVTVLAAVDLFISSVIIPLELLQFGWQYTYNSVFFCKLTLFVKPWATITSGSLLLCIAVDRYRKVCKPFHWQISFRAARNICFGSAFLGISIAWISPVIYSIHTKELGAYNVTISECAITESMKKTRFVLINNVTLAILFVGAFSGIIILYILIAIRVKEQLKRKIGGSVDRRQALNIDTSVDCTDGEKHNVPDGSKSGNTSEIDALETPNCEIGVRGGIEQTSFGMHIDSSDYVRRDSVKVSEDGITSTNSVVDINAAETTNSDLDVNGERNQAEENETDICNTDSAAKDSENVSKEKIIAIDKATATSPITGPDAIAKETRETCKSDKPTQKCLNARSNRRKKYRTTLIMFIVSLAFVVSYLPLLSLLLIGYADKYFVASLNDSGRTAYKFIFRSYLLNCAVNPVIYGIWDVRFRKSCKMMLTCRKT